MANLFRLDGKVAVVIGGAGGIGEALAHAMSEYGAKLVVASRNIETLNKVAREIHAKTGGEVFAVVCKVLWNPASKSGEQFGYKDSAPLRR